MSIGSNIRKIRERFGLTQEEFGKIADVSSMAVSQWENDRAVPRMGAIQAIADYFKISKGEIIDEYTRDVSPVFPGAIKPQITPVAYAPLRGRVHAGDAQDPEVKEETLIALPEPIAKCHPRGYFLEVEGDCMNKVYPEGCLILVDPEREPVNGSIAAVVIDDVDYVVRRLLRTPETLVLAPESFNEEHRDIVLRLEDGHTVNLVGTVVWFQSSNEME